MKVLLILIPAVALALSGCRSSDDDDAVLAAQPTAEAPAAPATAQAPAGADPATMLALTEFTVVDPNGIHSGTFRNAGGTTWTGPDLVRGGALRLEQLFKREDQMLLEAVRQDPVDVWDLYEVSIQASGRVYVAYRDEVNTYPAVPDHTAINLKSQ